MRFHSLIYWLLIVFLAHHTASAQNTWYVKSNATGLNNGTSWADAFTGVQPALDAAQPGDQIWISAGLYYPTRVADGVSTNDRHRTFLLPEGIAIYGGFAGNELPGFDLSQRDFTSHTTIFSGDIDQDDDVSNGVSVTIAGNNAYHVITAVALNDTVTLDGITITGGSPSDFHFTSINVKGHDVYDSDGAGLAVILSKCKLRNLVVDGNIANRSGGGLYIGYGAVHLSNSVFKNNQAKNGGGLNNYNSNLVVMQTVMEQNTTSESGGGWYGDLGSTSLINCIMRNNVAGGGGGWTITEGSCFITNSLIADNEATVIGGGCKVDNGALAVITNSTISGNRAPSGQGGGIYDFYADLYLRNSILSGNDGDEYWGPGLSKVHNSIVGADFYDNTGTLIANTVTGELFRNASAGDYTLAFTSVAINAGDSYWFEPGNSPDLSFITTDMSGTPRINAGQVDLGAFELPIAPDASGILYVNGSASPALETGTNWSNPIKELADALIVTRQLHTTAPGLVKEIWVASGTYLPMHKVAETDANGNPTTDRDKAFVLVSGVHLFGGFGGSPGTEGNRTARDYNLYQTILDGDLDQDGTPSGNAWHVVLAVTTIDQTILDGFVIRNGCADGPPTERVTVDGFPFVYRIYGGGILNASTGLQLQNIRIANNVAAFGGGFFNIGAPVLRAVIFENNRANENGGGMLNQQGAPLVENCVFQNNVAINFGGGWYNQSNDPDINTSTFTGNQAVNGAGMYNFGGAPKMDSLLFSGNVATPTAPLTGDGFGGGLYANAMEITITNSRFLQNSARRGAGIYNYQANASYTGLLLAGNQAEAGGGGLENFGGDPVIVNSQFSGNVAPYGGGMNNTDGNPVLVHTTFAGNQADWGGGINNNSGTFIIKNSVLRSNAANLGGLQLQGSFLFAYNLVDDTYYQANNGQTQTIPVNDADLFLNPQAASEAPTVAGNYRLAENSWLIDKGNANVFQPVYTPDLSHITTDLAGSMRVAGVTTDLGAFEFDASALPVSLLYFSAGKNNNRVRLSWATAMEQNNHRFEIEHSTDGQHYRLLHTLSGAGNSSVPRQYLTFHDNPAIGVNYYRLKQFDFDGRMKIHGVQLVHWNEENSIPVRLYPNPAPGYFRVSLTGITGDVQLRLMNSSGKVVHQQAGQLPGNASSITVKPAHKLPGGIYVLQITGAHFNKEIKVAIQ